VAQLSAVRNAPDTMTKWNGANATLVQATLQALPQLGFTQDMPGLQAYTEAFATHMRDEQPETRQALERINEQKWAVILRHAFGCDPAPPISLSEARALTLTLTLTLTLSITLTLTLSLTLTLTLTLT